MSRGIVSLLLVVALVGCDESLFTAPPKTTTCGEEGQPCMLGCELPCAARVIDLAEICVLTLEGALDETRRRCSFDDGSFVRFKEPLASTPPALRYQTIDLTVGREGEDPCLTIRSAAGGDGDPSVLEVTIGGLSYRQELWRGAQEDGGLPDGGLTDGGLADGASDGAPDGALDASADGGPVDGGDASDGVGADRLRVSCDGTFYEQQGEDLCACGGDAGCGGLPLLHLVPQLGKTIEFYLVSGSTDDLAGRSTPLFTCSDSANNP